MKIEPILPKLSPCEHPRYEALPLFGSLLEEFFQWLQQKGYTRLSLRKRLQTMPKLESWFRRRGKRTLDDLNQQDLHAAYERLRGTYPCPALILKLRLFLGERALIPEGHQPSASRLESELIDFAGYLRDVRGLAERSIETYQQRVRLFLKFLRFDARPSVIRRVDIHQVESFLRSAAKTNHRVALQSVVSALRNYLRRQHAQGILSQPLHEQIDRPRIYGMERLPRALPWDKVSALVRSIDCTQPGARRDFTIVYLAARYGLRRSELVHLRLEDIDWRAGTLRVRQSKTKQALVLPLTDEAGDIIYRYLREARPPSPHRELFLRQCAPVEPLTAGAVGHLLKVHVARSGLPLGRVHPHALRHSLAVHLLREGVPVKAIGDALGHRSVESTGIYLRLSIDELRQVGLPLPRPVSAATLRPDWKDQLPRVRTSTAAPIRGGGFRSSLAASLREYVATKRALGRRYAVEAKILQSWDDHVHRYHRTRKTVTAVMFQGWADERTHLQRRVQREALRIVRNFLLYHRRRHPHTAIPDPTFFPQPHSSRRPRLVSRAEIALILATAKRLPASCYNPLRAQTVHLGLALLFCCGLRDGELLRLRLEDFDSEESLLRITNTKFYKSRLVPLPGSVATEVRRYLALRRTHELPLTPDSHLIWCGRRTPPHDGYEIGSFTHIWRQLCVSTAVLDAGGRPPHLHDLRHSMAVSALHRWYGSGRDPQSKLPYLAAYLGHVSLGSTYYYLHLTPELRQAASQRFRQRFVPLFKKGALAP